MFLIYGKGKVGQALAKLCDFLELPYEIHDDQDPPRDFDHYDAIIPSPGVPGTHAIYASGKIISELDFIAMYLPPGFTTVAITGTDGKSSTAWIVFSILDHEFSVKKPVYLTGNFDIPLSETLLGILQKGEKKGILVIEVSSFMAFSLERFSPDYTIFTNFKPDHLDWHSSEKEYFSAKWNLVTRTKKVSILHENIISEVKRFGVEIPKSIEIFGICEKEKNQRNCTDGENIKISGRRKYLLSETHFSGMHNALNLLSVGILMRELKICSKQVRAFLPKISGLPHRIETIAEKNSIRYIDDSKSTSAQSLRAALTAFPHEKLILIAGGHDKGDTFENIEKDFLGIKYMILIGKTRELLAEKSRLANVPFTFAESMEDAVSQARKNAKKGDVVLLSPGCASFGMFRNYLDRAEKFREAIEISEKDS